MNPSTVWIAGRVTSPDAPMKKSKRNASHKRNASGSNDSPLPFRHAWEQELRTAIGGQNIEKPSTWKLTALWRAACLQTESEDLERELRFALDSGAPTHTVAALLREVDRLREAAGAAYPISVATC